MIMPLKRQMFVTQGWGYVPAEEGDHPEHPIYIPVDPPPDSGLSPEHPIYLPVYPDQGLPQPPDGGTTPPDTGARPEHPIVQPPDGGTDAHPEHPIYLPVDPPPDSGLSPEHPIYVPIYPDQGLPELPDVPPINGLPPEKLEALKAFLLGNLPPGPEGPLYPNPVSR